MNISKILSAFFLLVSVVCFGQNEAEPNNTIQTANTITLVNNTVSVMGSINPAGDLDFYKLNVPRSGIITYKLTNVPSTIRMEMVRYNSDQVEISNSYIYGSAGQNYSSEIKVCQAGEYYVKLSARDGNASSQLYTLTVSFDASDVHECNDNLQTATPIALNTPISAAIRTEGDIDFYKFTIPRAGIINYQIIDVATNIVMEIQLYDNNQVLIPNSRGVGSDYSVETKVCQGGQYYIRLNHYDCCGRGNQASAQLYNLTVRFDATDIYECNDNLATASPITLNTPVSAAIRTEGDIDFYKFTVPRAGIINYQIINVATNIVMEMQLYDNNQVAVPNSRGVGGNYSFETKICQGGQYYIRLNHYDCCGRGNEASAQLYNLTVRFDSTDVYECNDNFDQATSIQLCTAITGIIRSVGDLDYYQLSIPSSGITRIRLLEVPTNIDMEIKIYNASRVQVGSTIYAATGQANSFDVNLPTSGSHFIQFNDRNNDASSVNKYKFTIEKGCVTGSDELSNINFKVSPNPVNDRLIVNFTEGSIQTLHITNLIGQAFILQKAVNEKQAEIDVSTLPKGIYFLNLTTSEGKQATKKFVKN